MQSGPQNGSVQVGRKSEPSLFAKKAAFYAPDSLHSIAVDAGLYPYFRAIERSEGTRAIIHGRELIMAGSNNYLGLTSDPRVKEAAENAIHKYGSGCTGSRFLNGTLDLHIELEHRLASFMNKEGCVLFSTGYMTNMGVIQATTSKNDVIFCDKDNHACIKTGSQVSNAETWRYRHADLEQLRRLLEKADIQRPNAGKADCV